MNDVYPLLKPHDWPHKDLVAHRLITDKVDGVPLVAFGYDAGESYHFIPQEVCDDVEQLYTEALANLAALNYPWEVGESHGLRFATSSGEEFSSEQVLDPAAMRRCHALLEADRILAVAPRRTCLMAARQDMTDELLQLFIQLTMYTYNDESFGHAPISPAIFGLEDGEIRTVAFVE